MPLGCPVATHFDSSTWLMIQFVAAMLSNSVAYAGCLPPPKTSILTHEPGLADITHSVTHTLHEPGWEAVGGGGDEDAGPLGPLDLERVCNRTREMSTRIINKANKLKNRFFDILFGPVDPVLKLNLGIWVATPRDAFRGE